MISLNLDVLVIILNINRLNFSSEEQWLSDSEKKTTQLSAALRDWT